jgi:hypothetical protein
MPFDRRELGRLVLERIEAVEVPDHRLNRGGEENHPHRHRKHLANRRIVPAAQQMPGCSRAYYEGRGKVSGGHHVRQAIRKGRIEDHHQPVDGHDAAVDDLVALRRVHPAVRSEDPERRNERSDCDHHRRHEMKSRPNAVQAEHHDPEEAGFEKECRQHFVREQRASHAAGETREFAPIGAELVGHHDAGYDTHAERNGEHIQPEAIEVAIHLIARVQPARLEHREVARKPDCQRRKDDVERDREAELDTREIERGGVGHDAFRLPALDMATTSHTAMKVAAISGPITKPFNPKTASPPSVEISTT